MIRRTAAALRKRVDSTLHEDYSRTFGFSDDFLILPIT